MFEHKSSAEAFGGQPPSFEVSESEEDASMMEDDPPSLKIFETELVMPINTMKNLTEAVHRAAVTKPPQRLVLATSIILHKKDYTSTPIASSLTDTIHGTSASRRDVKAAVALLSLSSLVHSGQSTKGHSPFFAISTSSAFERPKNPSCCDMW
jgi:hypothetical protein